MTAVTISHSAIIESNLATVFSLLAQNLGTDAPYIISLNPSNTTATILLTTELSLVSTSAILSALSGIPAPVVQPPPNPAPTEVADTTAAAAPAEG